MKNRISIFNVTYIINLISVNIRDKKIFTCSYFLNYRTEFLDIILFYNVLLYCFIK